MALTIEIRPLERNDDRAGFSCGELALTQRDSLGCVGVVTDAKIAALPFYEKLGFVPLEGTLEGRLHGSETPMFLGMNAISATVL